jgi:hypothetical protein
MMKKYLFIVPALAILAFPLFAGAQFGTEFTFVTGVTGVEGVTTILGNIAQWFLTIVIAVSVIFFVYAGFLYVTSGGDDDKIKKAKDYLLYGVIGIAVALLAAAITTVVEGLISSQ